MADEQILNQEPPAGGSAGAVTRPDYIPETIWDSEKNAPKIDLAATLTEAETLKASAAERAALIPEKPDDYKFELPSDFELPGGYKWQADAKDPIVAGFRELATELKLTQPEVQRLVKFEATRQAQQLKAQNDFDAEQTKQLGANAEARRTAAQTWMAKAATPAQAQVLTALLDYKDGVEFIESVIAKLNGVELRGGSGDEGKESPNKELAENAGKPGAGMAFLRAANQSKN